MKFLFAIKVFYNKFHSLFRINFLHQLLIYQSICGSVEKICKLSPYPVLFFPASDQSLLPVSPSIELKAASIILSDRGIAYHIQYFLPIGESIEIPLYNHFFNYTAKRYFVYVLTHKKP